MPNSIAPAEKWLALLDEVYQAESKTSVLDSGPERVRWMAGSKEFKLAKISMDGLGDYSRSNGYPAGDVTLTWETHSPDWERGRMFAIDAMDEEESMNMAFSNLAGEFIRDKVTPELDAVRFARYAGLAGTKVAAALANGDAIIAALRAAVTTLENAKVPKSDLYLFSTPGIVGTIEDMDTTKSKEVLKGFSAITSVPTDRFYDAISLYDGTTTGETGGGFIPWPTHYKEVESTVSGALKVVANTATPTTGEIKLEDVTPVVGDYEPAANDYVLAVAAKAINFMIVHKPAVIQGLKHVKPKIITPDDNQNADAWKYGYRAYGIADAMDQKLNGIYLHTVA